jgi:hypothetical protein
MRHYIKIALRNLGKNPLFTALNIGGMSAGLAAALFIGLYVRDELSFDRFHQNADRIFRINYDTRIGGKEGAYAHSPAPMGPTLVREYRFAASGNGASSRSKRATRSSKKAQTCMSTAAFFKYFPFLCSKATPKRRL